MAFSIVMGILEMLALWESLESRYEAGEASKDKAKMYKLLHKALKLISENPKCPGLRTHEIDELTARYGIKVFLSYCENRNPRAMRVYWVLWTKEGFHHHHWA